MNINNLIKWCVFIQVSLIALLAFVALCLVTYINGAFAITAMVLATGHELMFVVASIGVFAVGFIVIQIAIWRGWTVAHRRLFPYNGSIN